MTGKNIRQTKDTRKTFYLLIFLLTIFLVIAAVMIVGKDEKTHPLGTDIKAVDSDSVCLQPFSVEYQPTAVPSVQAKLSGIRCNEKAVNLVFVLDRSENMLQSECINVDSKKDCRIRLDWLKFTAMEMVQKIAQSQAGRNGKVKIGVISYGYSSSNSQIHTGLTNLKDGLVPVLSAIEKIKYTGSGKCIECGVKLAESMLSASVKQNSSFENIVIIVTDGRGDYNLSGQKISESEAAQKAIAGAEILKNSPINARIFVPAFSTTDSAYMPDTVKKIASGNSCLFVEDAQTWDDVFEAFEKEVCPDYPGMRHFGPAVTVSSC